MSNVLDIDTAGRIIDHLDATNPQPSAIAAIKELRAATNWGLKESKDVIDDIRTNNPTRQEMVRRINSHPKLNIGGTTNPLLDELRDTNSVAKTLALLEENNNLLRDLIDVVSELTAALTEE